MLMNIVDGRCSEEELELVFASDWYMGWPSSKCRVDWPSRSILL